VQVNTAAVSFSFYI